MNLNLKVFIEEITFLKRKDGSYVINLDEYKSVEIHLIALYVSGKNGGTSDDATYFDSFGTEHILKEIKKLIGNKNILTNTSI